MYCHLPGEVEVGSCHMKCPFPPHRVTGRVLWIGLWGDTGVACSAPVFCSGVVWHVASAALEVCLWEELRRCIWRRICVWNFVALHLGFDGSGEHVVSDCTVGLSFCEVQYERHGFVVCGLDDRLHVGRKCDGGVVSSSCCCEAVCSAGSLGSVRMMWWGVRWHWMLSASVVLCPRSWRWRVLYSLSC